MTDKPKTWGEMTPEEKGALLLAHHEGKVIECSHEGMMPFKPVKSPGWHSLCVYRVKPGPVRGVTNLYIAALFGLKKIGTIDLLNGKPDCASIKVEKL